MAFGLRRANQRQLSRDSRLSCIVVNVRQSDNVIGVCGSQLRADRSSRENQTN